MNNSFKLKCNAFRDLLNKSLEQTQKEFPDWRYRARFTGTQFPKNLLFFLPLSGYYIKIHDGSVGRLTFFSNHGNSSPCEERHGRQLPLWARPQLQWLNVTLKNMAMSPSAEKNPNKPTPGSCAGNPVELLDKDLISTALTMVLAQAPVEAQTFGVQPPFPQGCG